MIDRMISSLIRQLPLPVAHAKRVKRDCLERSGG